MEPNFRARFPTSRGGGADGVTAKGFSGGHGGRGELVETGAHRAGPKSRATVFSAQPNQRTGGLDRTQKKPGRARPAWDLWTK